MKRIETLVACGGKMCYIQVMKSLLEVMQMDKVCTCYNIDGWHIQLPQAWKMTVDRESGQIIFDDEEAAAIYISNFHFARPETGEIASAETVSSIVLQAFHLQEAEECKSFSKYCPEGFLTHICKSITTDGYTMIACIVCTEGNSFSFYVVGDEDINFEKYIQHINSIERHL